MYYHDCYSMLRNISHKLQCDMMHAPSKLSFIDINFPTTIPVRQLHTFNCPSNTTQQSLIWYSVQCFDHRLSILYLQLIVKQKLQIADFCPLAKLSKALTALYIYVTQIWLVFPSRGHLWSKFSSSITKFREEKTFFIIRPGRDSIPVRSRSLVLLVACPIPIAPSS